MLTQMVTTKARSQRTLKALYRGLRVMIMWKSSCVSHRSASHEDDTARALCKADISQPLDVLKAHSNVMSSGSGAGRQKCLTWCLGLRMCRVWADTLVCPSPALSDLSKKSCAGGAGRLWPTSTSRASTLRRPGPKDGWLKDRVRDPSTRENRANPPAKGNIAAPDPEKGLDMIDWNFLLVESPVFPNLAFVRGAAWQKGASLRRSGRILRYTL